MRIDPQAFDKFIDDETGVIAMLFAIVLVPIMLSIGIAIDYGHASGYESKMQRALDDALIAGAQSYARSNDAAKAEAATRQRFDAAKPAQYPIDMQVSVDTQTGRLAATVKADIPTMFMGMAGFASLNVEAEAVAASRRSAKTGRRLANPMASGRGGRAWGAVRARAQAISERDIDAVIRRVEQVCAQLRRMRMGGRVPQCQAAYDGTFAEKLRRQLASNGTAGDLLPGGVRLVE